jgi:hypothetical protein
MRRLIVAGLATFAASSTLRAADTPKNADPAAVVAQLGASSYVDREAAARSLRDLGEPAIAPLELAAKNSPDAEIRNRAGRLVGEIKLRVESAKILTPKTLTLDYTDTPLATIINEVRQKTGLPVSLDPNGVKDPLRKVTVKSNGAVPMWEAVELVADAAGLKESFRAEIPVTSARNGRNTWDEYGQMPTVNPNAVPVLLADGKPGRLPGSRNSAVRVLALPPSFPGSCVVRGSGEAIINLDITPAPGINWNDVIGIHIHRAEDETGRPIAASRLVELASSNNGYNMVWMGGGMVMMNSYYYNGQRPSSMPNPRVVPLTLKTDDRASTKLVAFEGTVVAEATIPNVEVLKLENLEAVVQTPFDAGVGMRITVSSYAAEKDGGTKIKIRVEQMPVQSRRRGGANPFVNVGFMMVSSGIQDGSNTLAPFTFLTADGKPIAKPKAGPMQMVQSDFGYAQEVEATFPKDQKPVQLAVKGTRSVTLEVPFKMANVPLP